MLRKIKDYSQKVSLKRKSRVRFKLKKMSSGVHPRLSTFISNSHIHVQIIDDKNGVTLTSASTLEKEIRSQLKSTSNKTAASMIGKIVAQRAVSKGISNVVFDRGSRLFHGKVKTIADSAKENGLKI